MQADDARRKELCNRLIEAVKQCQTRFGARHEIAGDSDSSVICLVTAWENVLNDGLIIVADESAAPIAVLNTVSRLASNIPIIGDTVSRTTTYTAQQLRSTSTTVSYASVSFYVAVSELITESERLRFQNLNNVKTQLGRARSFLRAALNEKTLERTIRKLLSSQLERFYHANAVVRDAECASLLPSLAGGLDSVVFALSLDRAALDTVPIAMMTVPTPVERSDLSILDAVQSQFSQTEQKHEESDKQSTPIAIASGNEENGIRPRIAFGSLVELATSAFSTSLARSPVTSTSNTNANATANEPVVVAVGVETGRTSTPNQNISKRRKRPTVISFDDDNQSKPEKVAEVPSTRENECKLDPNSSQPIKVTNGGATTSSSSGIGSVEVNNGDWTRDGDRERDRTSESDKKVDAAQQNRSQASFEEESAATFSALSLSRLIPLQFAGNQREEVAESTSSSFSQPSGPTIMRVRTRESIDEEPLRDSADADVHFQLEGDGNMLLSGSPPAARSAPHFASASADVIRSSTLSYGELKQALVAVIQRKEDAERRINELRETVGSLEDQLLTARAQAEEDRVAERSRAESDRQTVQTLRRENELLRTQLKKYIGTVQSLKRSESTSTPVATGESGSSATRDYSFEAEQFEAKLVKMAELHGELLEFNDALQRELRKRDAFVLHIHRRLVELRGPLPADEEVMFQSHLGTLWIDEAAAQGSEPRQGARSPSTSSASSLNVLFPSSRPLVNIWIPNVYLIREPHDVHHVFQIYARVGDEEWNVFRRYSEFVAFHHRFVEREKPDARAVATLRLPPKKALGNRDAKFVEERRARLQTYLRNAVNYLLTRYPTFAVNVHKRTLADKMSILDEAVRERTQTNETLDSSAAGLVSGPGPSSAAGPSNSLGHGGSIQKVTAVQESRTNRRVSDSINRRSPQPVMSSSLSSSRRNFPNFSFRS